MSFIICIIITALAALFFGALTICITCAFSGLPDRDEDDHWGDV